MPILSTTPKGPPQYNLHVRAYLFGMPKKEKRQRQQAMRDMMAANGFTVVDAIEFISGYGVYNANLDFRRLVLACRKYLDDTRVGTVQDETCAVCEACAYEWFPTKEELPNGRRTRGLVCPDCGETNRYRLHDFNAYMKERQ
jgi:hypothetical protein